MVFKKIIFVYNIMDIINYKLFVEILDVLNKSFYTDFLGGHCHKIYLNIKPQSSL